MSKRTGYGPEATDVAATVKPPFDPSDFARESESLLAAVRPAVDDAPQIFQSETRVVPELPSGSAKPTLVVAREDLEWFELEAQYLTLAQASNGISTIADLATACSVETDVARCIYRELAEEGIIELR